MGGAMKYFLKKSLGHEIFRSMISWAMKFFLKNLQNPPAPPPTYLMYAPLEIPKNTPLTLKPSSSEFKISCVIEINWLMQEPPRLKPE